jgi:trimeric autotransporter adhesin
VSAMQVTATQNGGTFNGILLRVKVLTAVAAAQTGNTGSYSSGTGPARTPITTTVTGSRVYGAAMNAQGTSFTAQAGCTLLDNHVDATNGNTYGTFQTTAPTGTPGATTVGTSAPTTGTPIWDCAALEILPDGTIGEDASAPAVAVTDSDITVTTAAFDPPAGSLLVALVSSDGDGTASGTTMSVSGGGIGWTEVVFANSAGCYCGVWVAVAGSPPVDDPLITITQTGSTFNGMTARIKVLTGAAPSAAQTGATAVQSANAAHQASITTTTTGSIVYGGYGSNSLTSPTAAAGTTLLDSFSDAVNGNFYGTCRSTAATGTPGAATLGISAPAALGGVGLAEILPAVPGGTITEDASSPASVSTTSAITVQVNVSPPFGSLLVLMIGSDSNTGIVGMTVSGGGLAWRALVEAHAADSMYGGVWVADIPGAATVPPARPGKTWLRRFRHPQEPQVPAAGAAVIDSTGSSPAGAGAVTAVVTQAAVTSAAGAGSVTAAATVIAGAVAAGAGSVTAVVTQVAPGVAAAAGAVADVATQIAGASSAGAGSAADVVTQAVTGAAAGAGAVTAKAVQAAAASAAGAGAVTDVATQIAAAAAAAAGSVTAAGSVSGASTASVAGAGSVTAVVTQIAPAAAAGAGAITAAVTQVATAAIASAGMAGPAPATQIAPAPAAGAGAVADVATQIAIASAAGAGSVTAAGSVTGAGATASAAGAGAASAVATQAATAAAAGAGTSAAAATQVAKATAAGAGSVTAAGQITGTASVAGAAAASAKATQAVTASPAGAGVLSALATQRAIAAIAGAGSATAAGGVQVAFTVGALTAADTPGSVLTAAGAASALTASTAARSTLTAGDQRTGGPGG